MPEFVRGTFLIVIFSVTLHLLPSVAAVPSSPGQAVQYLLLPSVTLALVLFRYLSRMARAGTINVLNLDYYRTAVLKGLKARTIFWKHVIRNTLTPTIGVISIQIGWLIGGLVVVETVFNYPGIRQLMLTAAVEHDLPVLAPTVVLAAAAYTFANLSADFVLHIIDPRMRANV